MHLTSQAGTYSRAALANPFRSVSHEDRSYTVGMDLGQFTEHALHPATTPFKVRKGEIFAYFDSEQTPQAVRLAMLARCRASA